MVYTEAEIKQFLKGRKKFDNLKFRCHAYGIIGFIRLVEGYYMIIITEASVIARIES